MNEKRVVLKLSQGYIPLEVISWRKAVDLVIGRDKAIIITSYDVIGSFTPAVISLKNSLPVNPFLFFRKRFSKKNILIRDNYKCAYCDRQCIPSELTIDHVLPKSRGGGNSYENCVSACKKCNCKKDNKTPAEAGMILRSTPKIPPMLNKADSSTCPKEWKLFLTK